MPPQGPGRELVLQTPMPSSPSSPQFHSKCHVSGPMGGRCCGSTWRCLGCHCFCSECRAHCPERLSKAQAQLYFLLVSLVPSKPIPFPLDVITQMGVKGFGDRFRPCVRNVPYVTLLGNLGILVGSPSAHLIWPLTHQAQNAAG